MSRSNLRPTEGVPSYEKDELSTLSRPQKLMTRRTALKAMFGLSVVTAGMLGAPAAAFAAKASQQTTDALNSAQAQLDAAQAKLDAIAAEYQELNQKLNETVGKIEEVQAQIDAKQAEIDAKQDQLASRISSSYKTGNSDILALILNSQSFEEFSNNLFYMGKINASDEQLINDVKTAKAELEQAKAELEQQKAELEQLKEEQTQQLQAVQAKQDEASSVVNSLSDDVKALMAKRDAEIAAAAEEERRQAEAAKAAASAAGGVSGSLSNASPTDKGAAIVAACHRVGSPGAGLCAMWVSRVYQAAGLGYPGGNANNMYWNYCTSSNKSDLQAGMIVAVSTHGSTAAGRIYGHVGIYIGGGMVMENVGYINTQSLDSWIASYGDIVTPRWGWAG